MTTSDAPTAKSKSPSGGRDALAGSGKVAASARALVPLTARLAALPARSARFLAPAAARLTDISAGGPPWLVAFMAIVVLPTAVALLYFLLLAAPQFVSETRFVARGAVEPLAIEGVGRVSDLTGFNNSQEAHIVADHVHSREMVDALAEEHDLGAIYSRPRWDFIARLDRDAPGSEIVDYWRGMSEASVDVNSGVVTVRVYAFRPEDAQRLASGVLSHSEAFINSISERIRRERVRQAGGEVEEARADLRQLLDAIEAARNRQSTVSAEQLGMALEDLAASLRDERASLASARAAAVARLAPDSPTVTLLDEQLRSLDEQALQIDAVIAAQENEGTAVNLTEAMSLFDLFEIRRDLATQSLSRAEMALTEARLEVLRQQVYLDVFVPPATAESAQYPRGFLVTGALFLILAGVWGIGCLYLAGMLDRLR